MLPKKPDFEIIPCSKWKKRAPEWQGPARGQFKYVFFTLTPTNYCMKDRGCFKRLNYLQAVHMKEERAPDIRYNFVIGTNGSVYEGRGWNVRPTLPYRYRHLQGDSLFVALIGHYLDRKPAQEILNMRRRVINYGVYHKLIAPKHLEIHC